MVKNYLDWSFKKDPITLTVNFTITFDREPLELIVIKDKVQATPNSSDILLIRKLLCDNLKKVIRKYVNQRMMAIKKVNKNIDANNQSAKRIDYIINEKSFKKFFELIIKNQTDLMHLLPPFTSPTNKYWQPVITQIINTASIYSKDISHDLEI